MTRQQTAQHAADALGPRLTAIVAGKLGCAVTFLRWDKSPWGDIPVFGVPADQTGTAAALGLTVEAR